MSYYYFLILIEHATNQAAILDALRAAACIPTISREDFARLYKAATAQIKKVEKIPEPLTR